MARTNIISLNLSNVGTQLRINPVYQWDHGLVLKISGLTQGSLYYQFATTVSSLTTNMPGSFANGVWTADIPDEVLTIGRDIFCYVYFEGQSSADDTKTAGYTIYTIEIPVIRRQKPAGVSYTSSQISAYDVLAKTASDTIDSLLTALREFNTNSTDAINTFNNTTAANAINTFNNTTAPNAIAEFRADVDAVIDDAETATQNANDAADAANLAAQDIHDSVERADAMSESFENATTSTTTLGPSEQASTELQTNQDGSKNFHFSIPSGLTPDFSIGTVETLNPGEEATVTLGGTQEEPVLNFQIPRGIPGDGGGVNTVDNNYPDVNGNIVSDKHGFYISNGKICQRIKAGG